MGLSEVTNDVCRFARTSMGSTARMSQAGLGVYVLNGASGTATCVSSMAFAGVTSVATRRIVIGCSFRRAAIPTR